MLHSLCGSLEVGRAGGRTGERWMERRVVEASGSDLGAGRYWLRPVGLAGCSLAGLPACLPVCLPACLPECPPALPRPAPSRPEYPGNSGRSTEGRNPLAVVGGARPAYHSLATAVLRSDLKDPRPAPTLGRLARPGTHMSHTVKNALHSVRKMK